MRQALRSKLPNCDALVHTSPPSEVPLTVTAHIPPAARPPARLVRAFASASSVGALALAIASGVGFGAALAATPASMRPDLALKFSALAALPIPVLLLDAVTTPRNASVRRFLGESAAKMVRQALGLAAVLAVLALGVPVGIAASVPWHPEASADLWRSALLSATTVVLAAGLAAASLLGALKFVAHGQHPVWTALGGGGAFGPAESAPLLYAPAFALIAALVPAGLLAAVWGARADLLSLQVGAWALPVAVLIAVGVARHQWRAVAPEVQDALLAVEAAHATPFAQSERMPEAPAWVTPGNPSPELQFLARHSFRTHPGAMPTTALLVVLAALVPGTSIPPVATGLLAAAILLHATLRAIAVESGLGLLTAQWLGARPLALRHATVRLSAGLALPGLAALALGALGSPLAATLGTILGALGGLGIVAWGGRPDHPIRQSLPQLALAVYGAALAWATALAA